MTVKAHEDKTFPGAFIASLTLPWGQVVNADGAGGGGGGYHFVWARDLYHQVTSLLAAGDRAAAGRAVDWLFTRQQRPDGHFPQNSHVDGTPDQNNVQLDETAFPIILAGQVGRTGRTFYLDHIRPAADYLVARRTPDPAGALGDRGRLLPLHHGRPDRRAHRRRGDRPPQQGHGRRGGLPGHCRLVAAPDRGVDVHHAPARWVTVGTTSGSRATAIPTTATPGSTRTVPASTRSGPSSTPATSSSSGSASRPRPTRTSRPRSRTRTRRWPPTRPAAGCGTATPSTATASTRTAGPGPSPRTPTASGGCGRCCPASAASTSSPTDATRSATCRRCTGRPTTAT